MDAALASFVRGRTLVVDNGVYCERVTTTLRRLPQTEVTEFGPGLGVPPDLDQFEAELDSLRPDWIAVVHHETTTGLLNPLAELAKAARNRGVRVFVDAVSSFGAHAVDTGADVICFNSNKCLESLPGIAGVFWARGLETQMVIPVLDVSAYADAVPYTPHVQAFVALDVALDLLAAEDRPARYRRLAQHVWEAGGRAFDPLLAEPHRSNVLTSFLLEGRDADELFARALTRGYVIYHGQRELRSTIFRVANMGAAIDEETIDDLFRVLAE